MQRSYSSLVETSRVSSSWVDLSMELNNGSAPGFGLRRGMGGSKEHTTQPLPQHRAWRQLAGRHLLVLPPYHAELHLQRLLLSNPITCTVDSPCASVSLPLRK